MKKIILLIFLILAALLGFSQKTNYPYRSDTTYFISYDNTRSKSIEKTTFFFVEKTSSIIITYKSKHSTVIAEQVEDIRSAYGFKVVSYKVKDFSLLLTFSENTHKLVSVGIAKNGNIALFPVK